MNRFRGSFSAYVLMYFFYYFAASLFSGILAVYLMGLGYSATQSSIVASCGHITLAVLQPLIGRCGDRVDKRWVCIVLLVTTTFLAILFPMFRSLPPIAIIYSLVNALLMGLQPIIERMATYSRHNYTGIRIWATLGYAVGIQLAGILYSHLPSFVMYFVSAFSMLLCALGTWGTLDDKPGLVKAKPAERGKHEPMVWTGSFVLYIVITCLLNSLNSVNYMFMPTMFQAEGLSMDFISTMMGLYTLMEIFVLFFGRKLIDRTKNKYLMLAMFGLQFVQFGAYAFIPNVTLQLIAGLFTKNIITMSFLMINMKLIAVLIDESHQMTALAICASTRSVLTIIVQNVAGRLIDIFSFRLMYRCLFFGAAAGLLIVALSRIPDKDVKLFS